MKKAAGKLTVTEAEWVDAIRIARVLRRDNNYMRHRARRLFRLALALVNENDLIVEMKP